ncbi:amino acid permease [Clostridium cylindrosporum]|uniref:Amino acid transporter n=1 Tax=Clostridium cylindrosporum DSM 605 TaxID=1121307 RepID=A0A0J8D8H7_CLOCY|nr:amino acid permease [Clostridium cylindrosporum]KMT22182.1 amino acid transporter [Clostridium cylindrosporum DSM 605]
MKSLFRKKDVASILENNKKASLNRTLGAFDVTLMSIGAVIGTGVMVLTGLVAARDAGPAVVLSFIASAIVCIMVALCYAEFASSVPTSGSAYSYIYVSMGELVAHLVGWSLIIAYTVSTATVAGGWSSYFNTLLHEFGIILPKSLITIPSQGGIVNLPAIIIVLFVTFLLYRGTKESKKVNNFMVIVKLAVIILFVGVGAFHMDTTNLTPFMPYGWSGVFAGAASVFFAFTGFDAVSTSAEEVKNPQKNLPIGIITSLLVCTAIYVVVCLVLTSVANYTQLNVADAMAFALQSVGQGWAASLLSVGAVIGITAVMLAYSFGGSRILYSMSRDGLLPKKFSVLGEKSHAPSAATVVIGLAAALMAGVVDLKQLADLANITLIAAFLLVAISVIIFRRTHPEVERGFRAPFVPALPILTACFCLFLMFNLSKETWLYFGIWIALGLIIYFAYSRKHSTLNQDESKNISA